VAYTVKSTVTVDGLQVLREDRSAPSLECQPRVAVVDDLYR